MFSVVAVINYESPYNAKAESFFYNNYVSCASGNKQMLLHIITNARVMYFAFLRPYFEKRFSKGGKKGY